jgi:hypothetical protein
VVGLAASQASGDLPPTCPEPPGIAACVRVLPGQQGPTITGTAEGTAMLEVLHDLAPGAQLYFATAVNGLASFAQNIRDLRAAGCDIIVDDIGYFVESPFQDGQALGVVSFTNGGVLAEAVKEVAASGALYFSSAANSGNFNDGTSGTWEGDFADGGAATSPIAQGGRIHSFGAQTYNVLSASGGNANNLFWADPLGGSSNDYDLFLLNAAGTTVLAASINVQNGTQDPYEQVSAGAPGDRLVIVRYSGAKRFLHLGTLRGRLAISTPGETHGHSATSHPNSFGVAATAARAPGPTPSPFNPANVVETFSSDGPRRIFFNSGGTALTAGNFLATGGQVLNKPDLAAADRVSVTGNGGFVGGSVFTGTSAAVPHAAAIAALIKSMNPTFTPSQIRSALLATAIDIEAPGLDRDSGVGIVMALGTVQTGSAPPTITTQPSSQAIVTGTTAALRVGVSGTGPLTFQWHQGVSGDTSTPVGGATAGQFTTSALVTTTSFWVRVSNAFGTADSATAQITMAPTSLPVITGQPQSIGVLSGQSASIGVAASGLGLSYQWYAGASGDPSNPIGGATSAGFTTPLLTVQTSYWVQVTNPSGAANSQTAIISVGSGPSIDVQPASATVSCGQVANLSVTASGSAPLTFQWFSGSSGNRSMPIAGATSSAMTTPALGATSAFWVRVSNPYDSATSTTASITVTPSANCVQATYDAVLKAPKCAVAGSVCDAPPSLLGGRADIVEGPELHHPNTINNSCSDGNRDTPLVVDESMDALRISTVDGSPLAPGKIARVEATVTAFDPESDFLDLYFASDATNPNWQLIATLFPTVSGSQTLSATYILPAGTLQAVRAAFRFGGTASPCTPGTDSFDDRDDLIFTVNPVSGTELIQNGTFASGLANWLLHQVPNIVHNSAAAGEFRYHSASPPSASAQAVIFQETGASIGAGTPLTATFQLGNTDSLRKRIAVLVLDSDFSDLSVCTFWLPPNASMQNYQMKTHATKGWNNAAIYFYAASEGLGDYRLDNVSLKPDASGSSTRTDCLDPTAPALVAGSPGPDLLTNGNFSAGTTQWELAFDFLQQITGGVLEFRRSGSGAMAGVIFQKTNQTMAANQVMTSTFKLGNSSSVRRRVTVLLHDLDFTDLSACSFWLVPGQPLSTYTMRSFATKAWANATVSVYAASIGPEQWTQLDDVTFQRTPGTAAIGTECIEPAVLGQLTGGTPQDRGIPLVGAGSLDPARRSGGGSDVSGATGDMVGRAGFRGTIWQWSDPIDLTSVTSATLHVTAWLSSKTSPARVQVSRDGVTWETIDELPAIDLWTTVDVDLGAFIGQSLYLRIVFDGAPPGSPGEPEFWQLGEIRVTLSRN